jgi:hypothetical protein
MNVFKALYCNQYYELKPKGKGDAAKLNGSRLLAVCLAIDLILLVVILMVLSGDFADAFGDLIKDIFGRRTGRTVGKVLALIPFLIFLPLIQYTLGTDASYNKTISEFESLSPEEQKRVSKKGLVFSIISFANLFVAVALGLIFLA